MSENSRLHLRTLSIDAFRCFRHLEIEPLGRVNLVTGRNNTGKSSVLEAIRLYAGDASPDLLFNILDYREELPNEGDEGKERLVMGISNLLYGFPDVTQLPSPITIIANRKTQNPTRLSISVGWFSEERNEEGVRRLMPVQNELFDDSNVIMGLTIEAQASRRVLPIDFISRVRRLNRPVETESRIPCVFVNPYGFRHTAALGPLWDRVALSDREDDVTSALRLIAPDVLAVSMIGGEGPRRSRTAIVKVAGLPRPLPLRTFGDGVNRLFGIVLSLVNAKGGILLIDEIENGMHHTVQVDVWRAIFRIARELNVQVFATSHSWDSISAFQAASEEDPDEGVLIRLARHGDRVLPTIFREEELRVVTRDRIEVR